MYTANEIEEKHLIMTEYSDRVFFDIVRVHFSYWHSLCDWFHESMFWKKYIEESAKCFQGLPSFTGPLLASCEAGCFRFLFLCFYFFFVFFSPKPLKMHFKKPFEKNVEIFCEKLFTIGIFWTPLNFAKSAKIYCRKTLFI